jgi:hypothetical protein
MVGMLRIIGIAFLVLVLSSCGYQGQYRYPCQDPTNWDKAECNMLKRFSWTGNMG